MRIGSVEFDEVVFCDFEFGIAPGGTPGPRCMVAHEAVSGLVHRLTAEDLRERRAPPYPTDPTALFVAFNASAELACHLALGWPLPESILDLYVENRLRLNGLSTPFDYSLLGALASLGLPGLAEAEKTSMRELALRGGSYTNEERRALLDYCESDVIALRRLLPAMQENLDLPRALLRGNSMRAVARIERTGVPLDGDRLRLLRSGWPAITQELVRRIDGEFGVYEGTTFKVALFERWLSANRLDWPRLETGHLDLKDETFKLLALTYPRLQPLRELRKTLAKMRLEDLAVGPDDRNRPQLSPFGGRTSRFSTSPSKSVFGAASWLRGLVRPPEGSALAYVDYEQQEFGIAASLSNDGTMMAAYESGDAYLAFAKQAALVPADATKDSHSAVRELCKKLLLALQYGMGTGTLAAHLGQSPAHARELLTLHRTTYPRFWAWSDAAVQHANLFCSLHTVFGWTIHGPQSTPALRNFPMQANAAEMLRLACTYALDAGVAVCMPVHDALLMEAPISDIEDKVRATQSAMAAASADVLDGFVLRTDAKIFEYPNRFSDPRGAEMWRTVSELLGVAP